MTFDPASRQQERTNQILDAAATVFARRGFDAARMDDIAQEAGLSKGTLYWYFKSKESLTLALLDRLLVRQLTALPQLPMVEESMSELCLRFTRQFMEGLAQVPFLAPLTLEFYALAARHQEAHQLFRRSFQQSSAILSGLIEQGIERGEFRPVQVATVVHTITALFEGMMVLLAFGSLTTSLPEEMEEALRLLFEGLKTHA
jgi:AcrR family transcriptional regulator